MRHSSRAPHRHRFPHKGLLPEGHYFTFTWGIADEFGGMTTVALERSSAFASVDNRRVDILTLSPEMKDKTREKQLRAEGRIDRRVRIRNVWADLLARPNRKLTEMLGEFEELEDPFDDVLPRTNDSWTETRTDSNGQVLQVDRYRNDGTLLVSDRQDMRKRGRRGGRRITLFDRKLRPIGQWATARKFYHAWLDTIFRGKKTYLISDSSFAGGLIHDYRRDNVVICQVMHNQFLKDPQGNINGELAGAKLEILSHLDSFDIVATLTDRQHEEMAEAQLATKNLRTISNFTHDLHGEPDFIRDPLRGVMIARLARQKRVEHTVRAMRLATQSQPGLALDVYGSGNDHDSLTALSAELGVTDSIIFHGHTPGAKEKFHHASFSVLSSRFEGQPLTILESMSAGCIPIAYDIRYGPSDIITDGVDGFLLPAGDVEALAQTLVQVTTMSTDELQAMRRAALRRAKDFLPRRTVSRWGEVFAEQTFASFTPGADSSAKIIEATTTGSAIDISVTVDSQLASQPEAAYLVWKSREGGHYGRVSASADEGHLSASVPRERFSEIPAGLVDFFIDLVDGRDFQRIRISGDESRVNNSVNHLILYTTAHGNLSARIHSPAEADTEP